MVPEKLDMNNAAAGESGESNEEEKKPEFETQDVIRWIMEPTGPWESVSPGAERPFRPMLRPRIPVVSCLDDGGVATGQDFRLRDEKFLIGRTEGDVTISCDKTMSARHAVIQRVNHRGHYEWQLEDLGTANGTFVRVASSLFFDDTIVIVGGRRFRMESPVVSLQASDDDGTRYVDAQACHSGIWPKLVETGKDDKALSFEIRKPRVTVGALGGGCDISIDDPYLAKHHATISHHASGRLKISAEKSVNGVWANVRTIQLTRYCFFRCGEQVFRFVLP